MTEDEVNGERRSSSSLITRHSLLFHPLFAALAAAFLAPVLFSDRALLPTDYLMRMSPWAQTLPTTGPGGAARPELPWNPILWDAVAQFYPWRAFTAHWLRRGILPFWDPHQFCGTPFLANSQSAPLYPLHLLLLGFAPGLPVARAMALLAAIHLTLAGSLTFLWLRALRLSPFAASLGGIAFMFSSFAVTWLELPSFLTVACWLPLLFLTVHRVLEMPTGPRAAAVAVAVGLILLGGHLQIAFYCLLGAGLYALAMALQRPKGSLIPLCLALSAVLGLMLAAPQLLPAIELSRHSHRVTTASAAGYEAYLRGAMPAAQLVRLFMPDFFGNPTRGQYDAGSPADYTEFGAFIGGVGLLLAVAGLLAWRRRPRATLPAALIAVLSLLLALGTPLNALLYFGIPGFSQSGSPARVLVLFCFAGAWLAALGAEALTEARETGPAPGAGAVHRSAGLPPGQIAGSAVLPPGEVVERSADLPVGATFPAAEPGFPSEEGHGRGVDDNVNLTTRPPSVLPSTSREAAPRPTPTPLRRSLALTTRWLPLTALTVWLMLLGAALLTALIFVTTHRADFAPFLAQSAPALRLALVSALLATAVPAGLKRLLLTGAISSSLAGILGRSVLAALLLGELWFYGAGFNPTGPLAEVYPTTPLIAALRSGAAAGPGRILPLNHHWNLIGHPRALLPPNSALALGLSDPQGYDSLFIGRYKGFTNLLVPGGDSAPPQNGNMLFLWDPHSPLLPLLAADRIVSAEGIRPSGKRTADLPVGDAGSRDGLPHTGDADREVGAPWPLLYDQAGVRVYRYPPALPRAFTVSTWRAMSDDAALTRDLLALANAGRLDETALIEGPLPSGKAGDGDGSATADQVSGTSGGEVAGVRTPGPHAGAPGMRTGRPHSGNASASSALLRPGARSGSRSSRDRIAGLGPATVTDVSPNEVRATLAAEPAKRMLVLLDNHYPGWHAADTETGRPLPIRRADLTFRGIEVGEGNRTIRLRYEPATFRLGLFLSLLAVTSIAAICAAKPTTDGRH